MTKRIALTGGIASGKSTVEANYVVEAIQKMGADSVIPPKKNRKVLRVYDKHLFKERNLVERLFIWRAFNSGLNECRHYPTLKAAGQ